MVGRRNATIDIFDVRQSGKTYNGPRLLRTLTNPSDSKTVTALAAFPDGRHLVWSVLQNYFLSAAHILQCIGGQPSPLEHLGDSGREGCEKRAPSVQAHTWAPRRCGVPNTSVQQDRQQQNLPFLI